MQTMQFDHPQVVKSFLSHGADLEAVDKERQTALISAAYAEGEGGGTYFSPDSIKILLACGANVNHRNKQNRTAFIWGCQLGNDADSFHVASLLLTKGAEVSTRFKNGNTALKWAKVLGHRKTACLLQSSGARE